VARSPLALEAVTCASCGALVREDRVRCLRCGEPLVAASAERERHSAALTRLLLAGFATSALALAGVVAFRPSDASPATSTAARVAPAPRRAPVSGEVDKPAVVTSRDAILPGTVAYASGDMEGALANFERAITADPDDSAALNNFAQVLVRTGRARDALPYFDRAIALEPGIWAYHFNRARAFAELRQWSRAALGYQDALNLFPDDYATQFNLAKAQQKGGRVTEAISSFERAIELAPGQADFHLSHGLALEAAERPVDAAAAYQRYLELAETPVEADKVKERIAQLTGSPGTPR
jgi:tetratricopeptide (TPR) repeat protein